MRTRRVNSRPQGYKGAIFHRCALRCHLSGYGSSNNAFFQSVSGLRVLYMGGDSNIRGRVPNFMCQGMFISSVIVVMLREDTDLFVLSGGDFLKGDGTGSFSIYGDKFPVRT